MTLEQKIKDLEDQADELEIKIDRLKLKADMVRKIIAEEIDPKKISYWNLAVLLPLLRKLLVLTNESMDKCTEAYELEKQIGSENN